MLIEFNLFSACKGMLLIGIKNIFFVISGMLWRINILDSEVVFSIIRFHDY